MKIKHVILLLLGSLLIMASGKIQYTPYPSRAIVLSGIYSLLLSEEDNFLYTNPGFENGEESNVSGWELMPGSEGTMDVVAGGSYNGDYHLDMHVTSTPGNVTIRSNDTFNLTGGSKYKMGFAIKAALAASITSIIIGVYDENGLPIHLVYKADILPGAAWKMCWFNFIPDRNYSNCIFGVSFYCQSATAHLYLDYDFIIREYLDFGTEDFSIDLLWQPLLDTGEKYLVRKCVDDFSRGWKLTYSWSDFKYYLTIADGTDTATISSNAISQVEDQEYHWLRLTVDRTGLASFFVNGAAQGSGSVAAVTGNISVESPLRLFGQTDALGFAKGWCDFIRFTRGTLMSTAWMAEEWSRIQRGRIRRSSGFTALWDFSDNLVDDCQGLILGASPVSETPTYTSGWPYNVSPLEYQFARGPRHDGFEITPLTSGTVVRAKSTGKAYLYPGPSKMSYKLPFKGITDDQWSAFMAACEGGEVVDLWLDSAKEQTDRVYFTEPPEKKVLEGWDDDGNLAYETELNLEGV